MTAARSVTLCASSPDSRTAACLRGSCDELDGVVAVVPLAAVLPEWARKMTNPATTATSAAATITGTSGRRERRRPPEAGARCRPPSIAAGRSPDGTGPRPSTRVASGSAGCSCTLPGGGAGHGCGPGGGVRAPTAAGPGGRRRGAYQESQGPGSDCDSGAARGDNGGGNVDCGEVGTIGNGAVDGSDGAPLPVPGCPQNGQNRDPGCTGYPHAGLPQPATPAIVTAG